MLTLKSLGLSLARITELFGGRVADLPALLALQEDVLTARITDLQRARQSVQAARAKVAREARLSLEDLIDLIKETTMSAVDETRLAASAHQVLPEAIDPRLPGLYAARCATITTCRTGGASSSPPTACRPSTGCCAASPSRARC